MACNLLTRLLPFRRRRQERLDISFIAPALPSQSASQLNELTLAPQFNQIIAEKAVATEEEKAFFYLGCLAEQGSCTLILSNVPAPLLEDIVSQVSQLPGYINTEHVDKDIFVTFATAGEAAMALATQPALAFQYAEDDTTLSEPARKRMKVEVMPPLVPLPKCQICSEELNGAYSKPCFYCKSTWCYDCLQSQFTACLEDQERFPAKCCSKVLHFDVARGIVPTPNLDKYRTRFEQYNTTKPIYCAHPQCSTFLPPRIAKPNERGHVTCPKCTTVTCGQCRAVVDFGDEVDHKCVGEDEMIALLKQFEYKRCPRCNGGVAKMYGCSHVRCQCGAHWCWDCQRPIQICWSRPCERAREDGGETDDYDVPEEENDGESEATQNQEQTAPVARDAIEPRTNATIAPLEQQTEVVSQNEGVPPVSQEVLLQEAAESEPALDTNTIVQVAPVVVVEVPETPAPEDDGVIIDWDVPESQAQVATVVPENTDTPTVEPQAVTPRPAVPVVESMINLDADDMDDWEAGSFDFGEEPIDEAWDTWGCMHNLAPVPTKRLWVDNKQWLPDTINLTGTTPTTCKQIDCMRCYKTVTLVEPTPEIEPVKANPKTDSATDVSAPTPDGHELAATGVLREGGLAAPGVLPEGGGADIATTVARQQRRQERKKRKAKKAADAPKLFNCGKCGVFYCVECKKAAGKEIHVLLQKQVMV